MSPYEAYFDAQVGRGKNFNGSTDIVCSVGNEQRGCGIGRFLGGVYRRVLPLIKQGSREVGKEAVRAGFNVVNDIAHKKIPIRDAIQYRVKESGQNLKRKAEEQLDKLLSERRYKNLKVSRDPHSFSDSASEQSELSEVESKKKVKKRARKKLSGKIKKQSKSKINKPVKKILRPISDIFTKQ